MRTLLRTAASLFVPPLCATCTSPCPASQPLCATCSRALATARGGTSRLPGIDSVTWAAPYTGVARDLVTALKFGGRVPLAAVAAEAMAAAADPLSAATLVAVPPAPARRRARGFDSAHLIAAALARRLEVPLTQALRRSDGPRQVGRRRSERLASPPRVKAVTGPPETVVLVDDVLTTGATLVACARALRTTGTSQVHAAVFARALVHTRRDAPRGVK